MGNSTIKTEGFLTQKVKSALWIASPAEDAKKFRSKKCVDEAVREGAKAAAIACFAISVPTLVAVRKLPWAKANINPTGQALIISAVSIAAYFITVDKTILACARKNANYQATIKSV